MRGAAAEKQIPDASAAAPDFAGLSHDLEATSITPATTMRTRLRLLRALVTDIIADVDEATRQVVLAARRPALAIAGPQAELRRARLPDPGRSPRRDADHGDAMVERAYCRLAEPGGECPGQGKIWAAYRVSSVRRVNGIHAYRSTRRTARAHDV
jgi:hypothetical protein